MQVEHELCRLYMYLHTDCGLEVCWNRIVFNGCVFHVGNLQLPLRTDLHIIFPEKELRRSG